MHLKYLAQYKAYKAQQTSSKYLQLELTQINQI
jgi:hypothetical protein